jgi:uncharacterized surface protein with fasciclin (FAS1) repeats
MRTRPLFLSTLSLITAITALLGSCGDGSSSSLPDLASPPDLAATTRKDIVDTAVRAGQLTTLVAAQGAGLESTLRGSGPFTVFAPTDAAFGRLPSFLLTKLVTAPYKTELGLILKYHVLASEVRAAAVLGKKQDVVTAAKDVVSGSTTTVESSQLTVTVASDKVTLTDSTATAANVVFTDLPGRNGVIHVIDKVLVPPGL